MNYLEEDFEQQRRRNIYPITNEVIASIPCTRILDSGGEIDRQIQVFHKELLQVSMRKNGSKEVGILIDLTNWDNIVVLGVEDGIELANYPNARMMLHNSSIGSLMFMHNHPKNSTFSYKDLWTFCDNDTLLLMTALCNNGNIHVLQKTKLFDRVKVINTYNKWHLENKGVLKVLQQGKELGLDYKFGRRKS